jgi:hypothetical protein
MAATGEYTVGQIDEIGTCAMSIANDQGTGLGVSYNLSMNAFMLFAVTPLITFEQNKVYKIDFIVDGKNFPSEATGGTDGALGMMAGDPIAAFSTMVKAETMEMKYDGVSFMKITSDAAFDAALIATMECALNAGEKTT